jgi:S-DNA-T family DNA segregation ATPase FtsK/SpoIIIE
VTAVRAVLADQLGGHGTDVAAIALLVLGALGMLGVFSDLAGPVGRGIDTAAGWALGDGRVLVPIACGGAAALLLAERARDPEHEHHGGLRIGLGLALAGLAIAGGLHVGGDAPATWDADALAQAGGLVGAAAGRPLVAATGAAGTWVVLTAVLLLGVLLTAGIGMAALAHGVAAGVRQAGRGIAAAGRWVRAHADLSPSTGNGTDEPGDDGEPATAIIELSDDDVPDDTSAGVDSPGGEAPYDFELDGEGEPIRPTLEAVLAGAPDGDFHAVTAPPRDDDAPPPAPSEWKLPELDLLKRSEQRELDERFVSQGGEVLERTLRDFGVDARLVGATVGPTVTRYELELAAGVKVNKVTGLAHDIAYAMASPDVRILAPIPGRSAIGVEVPNKQRQLVTLGDILTSAEADRAAHPLEVGLGRDIAGRAMMVDLSRMPHLLIAGQTGAGKSSCINSIVTSILMRATPEEVRLILVDPKRVELGAYSGLPHLLTDVVTNPKRAANALDWAVKEMELRYDLLAEVGVRDIAGYNAMYDRGDLPTEDDPDPDTGRGYRRLPYILVVVDELNDLMMVAARDVEASICRIAQMARAVGIHLIIATQRPSVDVITGVIKANIPSRLAFAVSALQDSRVILDQPGAEKLIGQGDGLMLTASSSRAQRVQGAWVDETCVRKVVAHWRRQCTQPEYVAALEVDDLASGDGSDDTDDSDDLLDTAMELVVRSGLGSTSMLQRKLRVGFARAGRIMDLLERRGVVGPSEGSKARAVLMTVDELDELRSRA